MAVGDTSNPKWLAHDIPINHDLRLHGAFNGKSREFMEDRLAEFLQDTGLWYDEKLFQKALYLVQDGLAAFQGQGNATVQGVELFPDELKALQQDEVQRKEVPRERKHSTTNNNTAEKTRNLNSSWNINTRKWNLRPGMWQLVIFCALGAAVQGWDEAAINGAQPFFLNAFGLDFRRDPGIVGLINGAPYLCCVFSCALTPYLNRKFGRRGTIFWTAVASAVFALLQGFAHSWQSLFTYRLLLGLGIGPKSATIPIYATESAPHTIRGSLVMLWQLFTACGIMLGSISGVVFEGIGGFATSTCQDALQAGDQQVLRKFACSMNWRFTLASPMVAPTILAIVIWTQPESPRWTIAAGHRYRRKTLKNLAKRNYQEAFDTFRRLRSTSLQAARDMFAVYYLLERDQVETYTRRDDLDNGWRRKRVAQLFTVPRNLRATVASVVCMFAQQFCGVNAIIYYSNTFFVLGQSPTPPVDNINVSFIAHIREALLFTMGFGIINVVFALPAFFTIDAIGRRSLLLLTFPFLALFQFLIAVAIRFRSKAFIWLTVYLFGIFYSPGEGPVPFVYAAESLPLYIRDTGMGVATSINWLFNWVIAMTFPILFIQDDYGYVPFIWYGGWCIILWFMIFFLVPETRQLSLEQLDEVFQKPNRDFRAHARARAVYYIRRFMKIPATRPPPFHAPGEEEREESQQPFSMPSSGTLGDEMRDVERASTVEGKGSNQNEHHQVYTVSDETGPSSASPEGGPRHSQPPAE